MALAQANVSSSKPTNESFLNTVVVFDFDDTLFPTTKVKQIMKRSSSANITPSEMNEFVNLSWVTYNLLKTYIAQYSKQNIFIVSASSQGWVKQALSIMYNIGYYAKIYHLLFDTKGNEIITICHPSDSIIQSFKQHANCKDVSSHPACTWKYKAFKHICDTKMNPKISRDLQLVNTFVIIGDSEFEYEAAKKLSECYKKDKNVFIHRIKLMHRPTMESLYQDQIKLYQLGQSKYYENYAYSKVLQANKDQVNCS